MNPIILESMHSELEKIAKTATKTNPELWERCKREAVAKMGGKHSARAMQLATQLYKTRGGGYSGSKPTAKNNSLKRWGKQKWKWSGGEKKSKEKTAGRGVYLPEAKIKRLRATPEGRRRLAAAARKKSAATRKGEQYSRHGLAAGTSLEKRSSLGLYLGKLSRGGNLSKKTLSLVPKPIKQGARQAGFLAPKVPRTPTGKVDLTRPKKGIWSKYFQGEKKSLGRIGSASRGGQQELLDIKPGYLDTLQSIGNFVF